MIVLGLDVSTTYTGVSLLGSEQGSKIPDVLLLDHIHFKGCNTIWDKIDVVKEYFDTVTTRDAWRSPDRIFVEDPVKRFTVGASSANTIMLAARFNGLVSYVVRNKFNIEPEYITSGAARTACGLKMKQRKKCGLSHKEQTFNEMMQTDLSHLVWDKKRNGKVVDHAYDIVDSYVIGKAGIRLTNENSHVK